MHGYAISQSWLRTPPPSARSSLRPALPRDRSFSPKHQDEDEDRHGAAQGAVQRALQRRFPEGVEVGSAGPRRGRGPNPSSGSTIRTGRRPLVGANVTRSLATSVGKGLWRPNEGR